jgi:FixJ family two-component response regulator/nitrogen-specific signal transduction histidine kinase
MEQNLTSPTSASARPVLLIVDDEDSVRVSLEMVFAEDFETIACSNSAEALATVVTRPVAVAILDIKMQGESGLDLLVKIKQHDPLIEVIILTGYESVDAAKIALRYGAADFQGKPFDVHVLVPAVAKALAMHRASQHTIGVLAAAGVGNELARLHSGVLHDSRNLLTVALGMTELAAYEIANATVVSADKLTSLRAHLKSIYSSTERCVSLLNRELRVVSASRAEAAGANLSQIVTELSTVLGAHADARETAFRVTAPDTGAVAELPSVDAFQIILNLALNAAQSRRGRHEVDLDCSLVVAAPAAAAISENSTRRVIGNFAIQPPLLAVTVRDRGDGIPADVLNKLFGKNVTTKLQGSGVGLPLVGVLVTRNSLLLTMESVKGRGTTATVYFPLARAPVVPATR